MIVGANGEFATKFTRIICRLKETSFLVVADDKTGFNKLVKERESDGFTSNKSDFRGRNIETITGFSVSSITESFATFTTIAFGWKNVDTVCVCVAFVETESTFVEILAGRTIVTKGMMITRTRFKARLTFTTPKGRFSDTCFRDGITIMKDFIVGTEFSAFVDITTDLTGFRLFKEISSVAFAKERTVFGLVAFHAV